MEVTTTSGISTEAATAIISACYAQLLGHPPDEAALRAYADSLHADAVTAFPLMLHHLNASATAERLRGVAVLRQIAHRFSERRGVNVRKAVSLGLNGYTTWLLSAAGMRLESYPFDTMSASPRMVAHCLNDDFAKLLTQSHYEPTPVEQRMHGQQANLCGHSWYRDNFRIEHVFNGSDPTQPADYAALKRSVEAFRDLANNSPATYVLTAIDSVYWQNGFAQVSRALRAYAPFTRLVYAVIREPGAQLMPVRNVVSEEDGHVLVEFRPSSSWGGSGFENPLDDIFLLSMILERL